MEFIIQNIGWFIGIGLVFLLALIGYMADKNEQKKNENINNAKDFINNDYVSDDRVNNNVDTYNGEEVNVSKVSILNNDVTDNMVNFNNDVNAYNNDVADNMANLNNDVNVYNNVFNDIEDSNLSLEDLEKKNYRDILSSRDDDSYDYADNDIPFDEHINVDSSAKTDDIFDANIVTNDLINNKDDKTLENSSMEEFDNNSSLLSQLTEHNDDIYDNKEVIDGDSVFGDENEHKENYGLFESNNGLDTVTNDGSIKQDIDNYAFVSEVDSSSVPELSNDYSTVSNELEDNILDTENVSEYSSDEQYSDDDIWRF